MGAVRRIRGVSPRTSGRLFLACLALLTASSTLPGVAQAHGGGSFVAGSAATTPPPTIDGVVSPAEWADSTPYSVDLGSFGNATVRFVHTTTDLYVGVVVQDPSPALAPEFAVFFDNNHDGVKELGDDAWLAAVGGGGEDFFWNPAGPGSHVSDLGDAGTGDTVAAGTSSDEQMFEHRHPLCSADPEHDICASTGQTLGIDFQYSRNSSGAFVAAPGPNLLDPSNNWADLVLAAGDVVAPTVDVTAPAAGTVVRGTVSVSANASDSLRDTGGLPLLRRRAPLCRARHRHGAAVHGDVRQHGGCEHGDRRRHALRGCARRRGPHHHRWKRRHDRQHVAQPNRVRERSQRQRRHLRDESRRHGDHATHDLGVG